MLYILHRGNHPDLNYAEGQRPIVHLQADLSATIEWADNRDINWAFSDRNAGAYLADFFDRPEDLDKVNWNAVAATDFRGMVVKEGKQAEFLVYEAFPWTLVEKIGVVDAAILGQVSSLLESVDHKPSVSVERGWYY